jgi:outer membrane protein OmpA-like peptidoglycan-associated protein
MGNVEAQEVVEDTTSVARVPKGLIDDMLATNEQLHLPVAVVRFADDDDELDNKALRQLNMMVSQIKSAEGKTEFYIIASADDASASQRHNRKLCRNRSQEVYEALTDDFGVDKSRLKILPDGGFSEYEHQYSERMVLIIQHTPETEEVLQRWIPTFNN